MKLNKEEQKQIIRELQNCQNDIEQILNKLNTMNLYDYRFSLKQISKILHVSKQRVKQIENKALEKLRANKELFDDFQGDVS